MSKWSKKELEFLRKNRTEIEKGDLKKLLEQLTERDVGIRPHPRYNYGRTIFLLYSFFNSDDSFSARVDIDQFSGFERAEVKVNFSVEYCNLVNLTFLIDVKSTKLDEYAKNPHKLKDLVYKPLYDGLIDLGLQDFPNRVKYVLNNTLDYRFHHCIQILSRPGYIEERWVG